MGVIVQVRQDGSVIVSGIVKDEGVAEVEGIETGDQLLRVEDQSMTGASLATVLDSVAGTVGAKR